MVDVTDHSDIRSGDDVLLLGGTGEGPIPCSLLYKPIGIGPSAVTCNIRSRVSRFKCISKIRGIRPTIGNVRQPQNTAGESEEAAGRCDEGVFLRIGYSKIATGTPISTANFTV